MTRSKERVVFRVLSVSVIVEVEWVRYVGAGKEDQGAKREATLSVPEPACMHLLTSVDSTVGTRSGCHGMTVYSLTSIPYHPYGAVKHDAQQMQEEIRAHVSGTSHQVR